MKQARKQGVVTEQLLKVGRNFFGLRGTVANDCLCDEQRSGGRGAHRFLLEGRRDGRVGVFEGGCSLVWVRGMSAWDGD